MRIKGGRLRTLIALTSRGTEKAERLPIGRNRYLQIHDNIVWIHWNNAWRYLSKRLNGNIVFVKPGEPIKTGFPMAPHTIFSPPPKYHPIDNDLLFFNNVLERMDSFFEALRSHPEPIQLTNRLHGLKDLTKSE